jgi:hypothetical protein
MSRSSNVPTGWPAFRLLRQKPALIPSRRHGNWVHGRYSISRIEGMRKARLCLRILRSERWLAMPDIYSAKPLGWEAYRIAREEPPPLP